MGDVTNQNLLGQKSTLENQGARFNKDDGAIASPTEGIRSFGPSSEASLGGMNYCFGGGGDHSCKGEGASLQESAKPRVN